MRTGLAAAAAFLTTPAIALTGYVRVEERMRALEAGFQMFVPKPVETNELISLIGDLCPDEGREQ